MQDLWRLTSLFISLAGFLAVAGISLYRGDAILGVAIRSLVVFAVLWFGQRILQSVLGIAADTGASGPNAGPEAYQTPETPEQ